MFDRLRRLMPTQATLQGNRWLRWLGPGLFHPRLWHMSRRGIAMGAAIGVFFAFVTPVAQIPLSAAVSIALRANIPAAVVGTLVNTPPTFAPVYWAAWKVGSWMLGEDADDARAPVLPGAAGERAMPASTAASGTAAAAPADPRGWWQRSVDAMREVGKPLALGALTFSVVFSVLAYFLVNGLWHLRVRLKRRARLRARSAADPPR
jgi:uncharacterized protein